MSFVQADGMGLHGMRILHQGFVSARSRGLCPSHSQSLSMADACMIPDLRAAYYLISDDMSKCWQGRL